MNTHLRRPMDPFGTIKCAACHLRHAHAHAMSTGSANIWAAELRLSDFVVTYYLLMFLIIPNVLYLGREVL